MKIKYFGMAQKIIKKDGEEIKIKDGITVNELLEILFKKYGKNLKDSMTKKVRLNEDFIILLNGRNIETLNNLETKVMNKDGVIIMPIVEGG